MRAIAAAILGPLAYPECRRSAGRGWIILVRGLSGGAAAVIALCLLWWWWFNQDLEPGRLYLPYAALRVGLVALEITAVAIALVMSPAVLAGSLAGDKERGSLGLLLTTRVNALEIVLGRLAGKLCQVGQILLAGVPFLILIAALAAIRAPSLAAMLALPAAVAFGIGGISLAASAASRRGRDALLAVYLLVLLFLLSPLLGTVLPAPVDAGIEWLSPFAPIFPLAWDEDPAPALRTMLGWVAMGLAGIAVSAWRLRPACLRPLAGESIGRRRGRRRWFVPPVDERRPMLWKELFIERVGSIGRVGRWIGLLIVVPLVLVGAAQAGFIGYYSWVRPDPAEASDWTVEMGLWIGQTGWWVSALIQLGIGLRAAVAISSERERGTWDALLTSPLEGREIVVGKVWGSLHSLRWLFGAALWAWTLALFFGAMTGGGYAYLLAETLICGAFMAAVGVRASLAFSTATRSMAVAVGIWLGALGVIAALSATTVMVAWMVILVAWWTTTGDTTFAGPRPVPDLVPGRLRGRPARAVCPAGDARRDRVPAAVRPDRRADGRRRPGGGRRPCLPRPADGAGADRPGGGRTGRGGGRDPGRWPRRPPPRRRPRPTRGGGLQALVEVTAPRSAYGNPATR